MIRSASPSSPARRSVSGARNGFGIASVMPSPSRTSRSRRRRCCRTDSRPCSVEVATTLPTRSYPYIRATSSMTSISALLSPRHVGRATVRVSPVPETVKPIGSSSGGRSSAVNVVPMMRLTSLMRTSQERSRGGSAAPRASTAPAWTARSGARLGEQLDEAGDRRVDLPPVDAALVARRRLRPQAEPGDAETDADGLEPGDLQGDRGRGVADLGVGATHDPADADRHVEGVADQQVRPGPAGA